MEKILENNKIDYNSQILDIGCGNGYNLQMLADLGFNNLNGMEPFLEKEINTKDYTIFKSFYTFWRKDVIIILVTSCLSTFTIRSFE